MLPIVYPYKIRSASAVLLSSALSCLRVSPNRRYKHKDNHLVINWGCSTSPTWFDWRKKMLNNPHSVGKAANKLISFYELDSSGVSVPDWTAVKEVAANMINLEGYKIVCRTLLSGHSGAGIVIASTTEELVDAPLYTQFIEKDKEFRVHVFNGEVIDFQQKKRRRGVECNDDVRNHHTGWVYARNEVVLPEAVETNALRAVSSLGLDFGAVDLCTDRNGNVFVFEVNTAPGITGSTLDKYVEAIKELL